MSAAPRKLSYMPLMDDSPRETNPFFNLTVGSRPTLGSRIRLALVAITLLPLRVVLSIVNILLGILVAKLATIGLREADYDPLEGAPLAAWRRAIFTPVFWMARFQLVLFGFWRIRVKGRCAPREEAPIIVANHSSGLMEGMFLAKYAKLAEKEYATLPVLGLFMLATSAIFVDRANPDSRELAKRALLRRCAESRWPQTVVFPEGVCTNGTAVVQFKLGAFTSGCAVQPVAFRYPVGGHDPSFTFPLGTAGYVGGLMMQVANHMEVEFLPVYTPSDLEVRSPALFAAGVQQAIAAALGVPTTKHAAEDVALCIAAKRLSMPAEAGTVEWQAISENLTGVRVKEAIKVMEQFHSLDREGRGRIDFPTFAAAMRRQVPSSCDGPPSEAEGEAATSWMAQTRRRISSSMSAMSAMSPMSRSEPTHALSDAELRSIFDLMDRGGDGYINFVEYLCGVAVLNGRGDEDHSASLKWTFDSLACGQSHFTKEQLVELICRAVPNLGSERLDALFAEADANGDGVVSREEFIAFSMKHREDLQFSADRLLCGLPMTM